MGNAQIRYQARLYAVGAANRLAMMRRSEAVSVPAAQQAE